MDLSKRLAELRHQRQQIIAAIRALELLASSRGNSGRPPRRGRPPGTKPSRRSCDPSAVARDSVRVKFVQRATAEQSLAVTSSMIANKSSGLMGFET